MSGGAVGHLSGQHLQVVQNLIERCIQLHMTKLEAVSVLSRDADVVPSVTELVWQQLEEENREFFQFYYIQLALKEQTERFNELLKKQAALMKQIQSTGVAHMGVSNGSRMGQFQHNPGCYPIDQSGASMRADNLQSAIPPSLPAPFTNGVSSLQSPAAYDMSAQSRRMGFLPDTLHDQSSNSMGLMQEFNGGIIKSESGYPSDSQIIFDGDPNVGEAQGPVGDASVATFSSLEGSSQPLNDSLLGMHGPCSSFGQLGHVPKTFSFPDLSAFPHVLEHYPSSEYITDADNLLDPGDRGEIQDESKGAMSGTYNTYEDFGSD